MDGTMTVTEFAKHAIADQTHTVTVVDNPQMNVGDESDWLVYSTHGLLKGSQEVKEYPTAPSTRPCFFCGKPPDGVWRPFVIIIEPFMSSTKKQPRKFVEGNYCCPSHAKGAKLEQRDHWGVAAVDLTCKTLGIPTEPACPRHEFLDTFGGPLPSTTGHDGTTAVEYSGRIMPRPVLLRVKRDVGEDHTGASGVQQVFHENRGSVEGLKPVTEVDALPTTRTTCDPLLEEFVKRVKEGTPPDEIEVRTETAKATSRRVTMGGTHKTRGGRTDSLAPTSKDHSQKKAKTPAVSRLQAKSVRPSTKRRKVGGGSKRMLVSFRKKKCT